MKEVLDLLVILGASLMILFALLSMIFGYVRYQKEMDDAEHRNIANSWETALKSAEEDRKKSRSGG